MSKKQQLLKLAEAKVRKGGYNNFSFRELANDAGIKSASVHYYFATKADLGAELAAHYTEQFLTVLGDPDAKGRNPVDHYINVFRTALTVDKKMCLCGLFGAESAALPDKVRHETHVFFERNIAWLTSAYQSISDADARQARQKAIQLIARLEGALLMANAMNDSQVFEIAMATDAQQ